LKSILDNLKSGPALVLIDEMLRGTNSDDKMMGSQKYIERISKIPSLTFVATHDLSLGNLTLSHENINNICFESEIREDNLFFDYLLKPGIAKNKNATWLMQKMDIIP
jgi:DNA mismatch repair ATPase MutS